MAQKTNGPFMSVITHLYRMNTFAKRKLYTMKKIKEKIKFKKLVKQQLQITYKAKSRKYSRLCTGLTATTLLGSHADVFWRGGQI